MNNIEKQYEKLLEMADKFETDEEILDDEQIEQLIESLGETTDPAQLFPSNNGIEVNTYTDPERNVEAKVLVSANPITGVLNTIPYVDENITEESLDKLLDLKDEDLGKLELNWDNFVETTKSLYGDLPEDELKQLLNAINKYRAKMKFSYFNELPESIRKQISDLVVFGEGESEINSNEVKQFKNMLAKELFDTILTNNYSTKAFADISAFTIKEINKEKEKLGGSIHKFNNKLRNEYEIGFIEKAKELEELGDEESLEKASKLRETSRMFTQSYTYEDMYEAYKLGKIKVKNIQIEKMNRTCSEFNRKYYNNTFKINDVGMVIGVLDRKIDKKYNITAIKKFIVAFINYTKNYSPSNIPEHVFMYYFIQNILALEVVVPEEEQTEFNDLLMNNINKFLDLIIEKDAQKEEQKKGNKENE